MQPTDRPRFADAMRKLWLVYDCEMSTGRMDVYWEALKDLSIEAVEEGASKAIKLCAYMPKPVHIRYGGKTSKTADDWVPPYERIEKGPSA